MSETMIPAPMPANANCNCASKPETKPAATVAASQPAQLRAAVPTNAAPKAKRPTRKQH
jgi:hypothetical protein